MPTTDPPHAKADTPSISRLDAFQRRHPVCGYPIAVVYKYVDDQGTYLAALITYYGFLSLFPLLLIFSTVLSAVLQNDAGLRKEILETAAAQFPIVGGQLSDPKQLSGGGAGLAIGIVASLYGGIGVAQALQNAMNTMWGVPRNSRPNPFKARGKSLLLLLVAGLSVLVITAISIFTGSGMLDQLASRWVVTVVATVVSVGILTVVFRMATAQRLEVRHVLPGAIVAAIFWQLLQAFGVVYVQHVVRTASTTNSVFALVLGLIAFIYIAAIVVVFSVEINVVLARRLYPRSLLTPFTDNVVLTEGDERAYTARARTERHKGFQRISVRFDRSEPDRSEQDEEDVERD